MPPRKILTIKITIGSSAILKRKSNQKWVGEALAHNEVNPVEKILV